MSKSITLQTPDTIVTSGSVLGGLYFAASAESDGSASRLITAGVVAMAEGAFTTALNPASLNFFTSTANASQATGKIKITDSGHIVPFQSGVFDLGAGTLTFRNAYVNDLVVGDIVPFQSGVSDIGSNSTLTFRNAYLDGLQVNKALKTSYTEPSGNFYGGTITFDMNKSNYHSVTVSGNNILAVSNVSLGQKFVLKIRQGDPGNYEPVWFNHIRWPGDLVPTFTDTASGVDTFGFICTRVLLETDPPDLEYDGFVIGYNTPDSAHLTFSEALDLLTPYAPEVALNFELPADSLYTDTSRTTPLTLTSLGTGIAGVTNQGDKSVHATQSTSSKRPTWGRYPSTNTRNLLTYTEDFANAVWTRALANFSGETMTATGAYGNMRQILSGMTGFTQLSMQVKLKEGTYNKIEMGFSEGTSYVNNVAVMFNLTTGAYDSQRTTGAGYSVLSYSITPAPEEGAGWYLCKMSATVPSQASHITWIGVGVGGVNGSSVLVRQWQTETGSSVTAYQKVVSAFDVTERGVKSVYGARFATDDCLRLTGLDLSGKDEVTVIAVVRKLSDAAQAIIVEHTGNVFSNNGAFALLAPDSPTSQRFEWAIRGTNTLINNTSAAAYDAPTSRVICGKGDISGDSNTLIIDNSLIATLAADLGTGNLANSTLNIGQRNADSLPFDGWIMQLFVCTAIVPDAVLQKISKGGARKQGRTI